MKRTTFLSVFVMIALTIASCGSSPLSRKYSDNTFLEDAKALKESKVLSEDDTKALAGYIIRGKLTGEKLEELTYGEILQKAKDLKAANQKAGEEAK